jgi:hypothetical protein
VIPLLRGAGLAVIVAVLPECSLSGRAIPISVHRAMGTRFLWSGYMYPRILENLNSGVVNSAAPGNRLARKSLSVVTVV